MVSPVDKQEALVFRHYTITVRYSDGTLHTFPLQCFLIEPYLLLIKKSGLELMEILDEK